MILLHIQQQIIYPFQISLGLLGQHKLRGWTVIISLLLQGERHLKDTILAPGVAKTL